MSVDDPWTEDVKITDYTDVDLEANRNKNMKVSDADGDVRCLVETIRRRDGLETHSEVCDRALRVELAHAIDANDVLFRRDEYDVAYTIPPASWVQLQNFEQTEILECDDVDRSGERWVNYSTPFVVHEMATDAVEDNAYESLSAIVVSGLERMLSRG